ncbi:MAG TPA: peptidylprolyl isomerase [Candidatus Krumholzibacteria bacterium]
MAVALALVAGCERRPVGRSGEDPGPMLARVDGHPLFRRDLEAYLPESERADITAEDRGASFRRWLATQLLYNEAQRNGLEMSRDIEWKLDQYRRDLIADHLLQQILNERAVVSRDEVMAYYQSHRDEFNLEVRVSHILTENRAEAEEALEMLKSRPFSWVARQMSVDKHTGAGGDLGYLSKGNMPAEFEEVVFKMRVGEVSEIIESEYGYHILKLTDVRSSLNELSFDAVSQEISRELLLRKRAAVYDSLFTTLRAKATIDVVDPELQYALELFDSLDAARRASAARSRGGFDAVPEPVFPVARDDTAVADTTMGE